MPLPDLLQLLTETSFVFLGDSARVDSSADEPSFDAAVQMKASQLNHRLAHLDFSAIHLFVEGGQRQSSVTNIPLPCTLATSRP